MQMLKIANPSFSLGDKAWRVERGRVCTPTNKTCPVCLGSGFARFDDNQAEPCAMKCCGGRYFCDKGRVVRLERQWVCREFTITGISMDIIDDEVIIIYSDSPWSDVPESETFASRQEAQTEVARRNAEKL